MKNMFDMMKQAKALQEQMAAMQEEVMNTQVEGSAGGGLVKMVLNGKSELQSVRIDPSLIKPDEAEILEDLLVAAHNDAKARLEEALKEKMQEMTGGMQLPPGLSF